MNNAILTPKIFARLVLMDLGNALHVCQNMSHQVTQEFAKKGNKVGATVQVRRPYRFSVSSQLDYSPQPLVDTSLPVSVSRIGQVAYDWDSVEGALSIREAQELYSKPAALALASKINSEAATFVADNTWQSVGTPGTAPTSALTFLNAGDLIVSQGLPEGEELCLIINRRISSTYINAVNTLFNPTGKISAQYDRGQMVDSLGYVVERDQTINTHTVGTYAGSPLIKGGNQSAAGGNNGTMTLITDGWTSSTLNVGDKFTIGSATSATVGGVQAVHPQTKVSTGYQQQFTVLQKITDTGGEIDMVIAPAITPATGDLTGDQYANVDSFPVDNGIITVVGATGATSQQGLLMHKTAYAFVSVPMLAPGPGEGAVVATETDPETGISLRLIKAFDAFHSVHIHRIDVLYDFARMYGEMACVIQS